jgi:hypothetical protein
MQGLDSDALTLPAAALPHTATHPLQKSGDEEEDEASLPPSAYELEEDGLHEDDDYQPFDGERCITLRCTSLLRVVLP